MRQRRRHRPAARPRRALFIGPLLIVVALSGFAGWYAFRGKERARTVTRPATNAAGVSVVSSNALAADAFSLWFSNCTDASELLNAGTGLLEEGRPAQAVLCYRRAIELKPDDEEAHFNLGVAYSRLGQLAEAERAYRGALEIFPEYAEARNNLGNVLTRQKRYEEAIAEFNEALKLAPENASTHNNLGRALAEQGDIEKATGHFLRAALLDTNYFEAKFNLGAAYLTLRKTNDATAAFEEALRLRPGFAPAVQALERLKGPTR